MTTSSEPGIYVVSLLNEEPISSQAGDPRNDVGAISVNKDNIKVGKARNLAAREKNYQKTFGADNVQFHPIALTSDQDVAEKVILRRLGPHRAINPSTGARVEWLENVTEAEAVTMAVRALQDDGSIRYALTSFAVMRSAGTTEPKVVDKPAKQPGSPRQGQESVAAPPVTGKNRIQKGMRILLAVLFGPLGAMFSSLKLGGLLLAGLVVTMLALPGGWPLYALVVFWGLSVWVALSKRDDESAGPVNQSRNREIGSAMPNVGGEGESSDPSQIYQLGRSPGALSEHNAKTWARIKNALTEGNGAASHDRLVQAASGHTDSAGRPRSAAAFVEYCVKNGWLVGAERS